MMSPLQAANAQASALPLPLRVWWITRTSGRSVRATATVSSVELPRHEQDLEQAVGQVRQDMAQVACLVERRDHDADPRGAAVAAPPAARRAAARSSSSRSVGSEQRCAPWATMLGDRGLDGAQRSARRPLGAWDPLDAREAASWTCFGRGSPIDDPLRRSLDE